MSAAERREVSARGGRMSHGGRGRDYEPDERFSRGREDYGDERRGSDSGRGRDSYGEERGFNRGFSGMDSEPRREFSSRGGSAGQEWRGDYRDYDEREGRYARDRSDQGYDDRHRSGSSRGFASMDPERRREMAARGGRASHGGYGGREEDYPSRSRDSYEGRGQDYRHEDDRWSADRSDEYDDEDYSPRHQRNEEDDFDYEARERGRFDDDYGPQRGSRRGFASWDYDDRREAAARGGRASHRND